MEFNEKGPSIGLMIARAIFNDDWDALKECVVFRAPTLPDLDTYPVPVKAIRDKLLDQQIHLKTEQEYWTAICIFGFFGGTIWGWHKSWGNFDHEGHTFTFGYHGFLKEIHDTQETISLTQLKELLRIFLKEGLPVPGEEPKYFPDEALAYLDTYMH